MYQYVWKNNSKRKTLYGRYCVILKRLKFNSAWVRFIDDNSIECVSRNALRVKKPPTGENYG
jgi:hypothetical protein